MPIGYEETDCPNCGVVFYVRTHWLNELRRTGGSGYCPNGHCWSFKTTETDKLRRERDRLKQRIAEKDDQIRLEQDRAERERRTASAYKGQLTKAKKRISGGACPCCNRSFTNLRRHMANKHPDYDKQDPPELAVIAGGKP